MIDKAINNREKMTNIMTDVTLLMHMARERRETITEPNSYLYIDLCNGDYSMLYSVFRHHKPV